MNAKLRRKCRERKRRLLRRIDRHEGQARTPMIGPPASRYEFAERQRAVACGGLGLIMELVKQTGLRDEINRAAPVFKLYSPYDEADHVLNIALNLLTGGTCLEHLEQRRNDEAYLGALAAPLDSLVSNWAYMVIASLAWTLKCWSGMMIRPDGPKPWREQQQEARRRVIRMEFATFTNAFMQIPARIVRSARRLVYRLLTYRPSVDILLLMHDQIRRPLRR